MIAFGSSLSGGGYILSEQGKKCNNFSKLGQLSYARSDSESMMKVTGPSFSSVTFIRAASDV